MKVTSIEEIGNSKQYKMTAVDNDVETTYITQPGDGENYFEFTVQGSTKILDRWERMPLRNALFAHLDIR